MNKASQIFILIIILTGCNSKAQNEVKRYEVKSGMIKYNTTNSGKMMGSVVKGKGTESLYFKNWGAVELKESQSTQTTTMNMFGQRKEDTTSSHTMNKLENGESYSVDFDQKLIYANKDIAMNMIAAFHPEGDVGEVGKGMLEGMGGEKIGHENMLGYDCEIWSVAGGKQWLYKGIMLKMEMTLMGITTTTVAQSAEFNISVADKHFLLPDFPIQKTEGMEDGESIFGDMGDMEGMEDMDAEMEKISKMSYIEWKKLVLSNDEEARQMSEEELRGTYDMMQKMMELRKKN